MKQNLTIILLLFLGLASTYARAESGFALKTNLLYDALLNVNLGAEATVAPRWSIDLSGNYNNWKISGHRQWKHWMVQPEVRFWRNEALKGSFFAAHLIGGEYNVAFGSVRRQGWAAGTGIGYGYAWRFAPHWGLEGEIAVGYARYGYDKYPCTECGRKIGSRERNYVGPTKAALNIVYYFNGEKPKPAAPEPEPPLLPVTPPPAPEPPAPEPPKLHFDLVDVPHDRTRTENLTGVARIRFAVNRTGIDNTIPGNAGELRAIVTRLDSIRGDLGMNVRRIELIGYASPEGSYANNDRLAAGRTESLKEYLHEHSELPSDIIYTSHVAEDWEGLRKEIESSSIPGRERILGIIDSDLPPDTKEKRLRADRNAWGIISRDMLAPLRRTEYRIEYEHQYEEREVKTLGEVNRAISTGDTDLAATLLMELPQSPEAEYAKGVVAAMRGEYKEAEAWFVRASQRGIKEAEKALHTLKFFKLN